MLKQMREGTKSTTVKVIVFGLLLLAMAGLALIGGQGTFRDALKDDTIVSFGRDKISAQSFDRMVQNALHDQHMKQSDAYRSGLPHQVLKQEIDTHVFAKAADDAGIRVDDTLAAKQIKEYLAPLVEKGMTEKEALERAEQAYGTDENGFVAMVKEQTATDELLKVITSGVNAPQQLVDDALKFRNEYRQGEYLRLTAANAGDIKPPSDAELKSYYNSLASEYALPEYRTLSVIILDKKVLGDSIKIADDRLKEYYDENISDYKTPETRVISQAVAQDEATAKQIYAAAQKNKDLQAASNAVAKGKSDYLKPAPFTEKDIAAELGKAAFSAQAGDIVPPVKSPLGWHVLYVEKIIPGVTKSFDSVKADIEKELSQDKISEALYKKANKIDDEIGSGKSVTDVAKENNIPETVLEKIDAHGMDTNGKKVNSTLPIFDKLVQTGFTLKKGAASQLIETPDGAFAIVGVKDIFHSEQQPFDKVRANVLARWTADRQLKALSDKAAKIMDRLKQGESFDKIAAEVNQPAQMTGMIQRGADPIKVKLESSLIAALFSLDKVGQATVVNSDNSVIIIRLADRKIQLPADTAKKDAEDMSAVIDRALKQDLLDQFRDSLMAKYDVKVNDKLLNSMYAPKSDENGNGAGDSEE